MAPRPPSAALRNARRSLEGIPEYRLLDDLAWHDETQRWFLRCRLAVNTANGLLPPTTDWCVVMEDRDPGGRVSIYPAVNGGITETFPHQLYNDLPGDLRPWRTGKICTTTPERVLGRLARSEEPLGLEDRLIWHVQRALWWIAFASEGTLTANEAPFELPDFPDRNPLRFVFSEDRASFQVISSKRHRSGLARLRRLKLPAGDTLVVDQLQTKGGKPLRSVTWGTAIANADLLPADIATWVLIDSVPLVGPWQVPVTYGELRHAMEDQHLSFDDIVLPLPVNLRDGRRHLLLVGFPIPEVVGGNPVQLHWQALLLPVLAHRVPDGFRKNKAGWKITDLQTTDSDNKLCWIPSENWSPASSHARGRFGPAIANRNVLIIGAGALGSAVAELLVRGGIKRLTVCDGDVVEQGNLARHTLGIQNVGVGKAAALAARLQSVSTHVEVAAVPSFFPDLAPEQRDLVSACDLIVDCTAEESTLYAIEDFTWTENAYAVSLSFGWYVHRLHVVGASCREFTRDGVIELLRPYEEQDLTNHPAREMVREGPGCWHPVFPGRSDDVWMMSAMATKELERLVTQFEGRLRGTIFKWTQEDMFEGVSRQIIS